MAKKLGADLIILGISGPRKIADRLWEMAKRGVFTLNIAGRQEIEEALRKGVGGIWLDLTREQYAKLRQL